MPIFIHVSSRTHLYLLVFCPRDNTSNHVCQVKCTPEKLPVQTQKNYRIVSGVVKKIFSVSFSWEMNCHHNAVEGIVSQTLLSSFHLCVQISRRKWQHHTLDWTLLRCLHLREINKVQTALKAREWNVLVRAVNGDECTYRRVFELIFENRNLVSTNQSVISHVGTVRYIWPSSCS